MRIMILGAGAVGGYFGARMDAAGSDITFLVREARAKQLSNGLSIESPHGNVITPVKFIIGYDADVIFDVIVLACKAYDLTGALDAIAPYVREGVHILPLLNGFAHLELIEAAFPSAIVLGGTAGIVATVTEIGSIRQMHPLQVITLGQRAGQPDSQKLVDELVAEMKRAEISATNSSQIEHAMWEKWTFLATLASATCLMQGSVGQILATDHGSALISGLFDECNRIAAAEGYPPRESSVEQYRSILFDRASSVTASMLRDIQANRKTEATHIIGDMIKRADRHGCNTVLLGIAFSRLQLYEAQRAAK